MEQSRPLYNTNTVLNILGGIIQNPNLLLDEKYNLSEVDFAERFHAILFSAISNLFFSGRQVITATEIDIYLSEYPMQKKVFDDNNGMQYIDNLLGFAEIENFASHYETLKKYTLLRELKSNGIDTKDFLNDKLVDPKEIEKSNMNFQELSVNDILNKVEGKIISVKNKFYKDKDVTEVHAGDTYNRLFEEFQRVPVMGLPLNSNIMNTVCSGVRLGTVYLDSSPTGGGKTRRALGNCAKISIPWIFNTQTRKWDYNGFCEPSLFITTELDTDEIATLVMAYVSGVPEDIIIGGKCNEEEIIRVKQANEYIQQSQLYCVQLPNYSPTQLEQTIKRYVISKDVKYVYFDYIHSSMGIISEIASQSKGMKLREDVVLTTLADKLKQISTTEQIHISTATQVSSNWADAKNPDSSLIASSKSIATKMDIAMITLPIRPEDLLVIQPFLNEGGFHREPNMCAHIYKVRRGKFNKIRVYFYFDFGTCRTEELFATNDRGELLDITGTNIKAILDETEITISEEAEDVASIKEVPPWEVDVNV